MADAEISLQSTIEAMAVFPEMNPGPVARVTLDGTILLVNAAARQLFGRERLTGVSWLEICPGLEPDFWQRVLAGEDMLQHEARSGDRVLTFTYRRPPGLGMVFIYGNDVTEQKRAERLIAEQSERLAEMARFPEMNPGPVLRADTDATIILANEAARDLFGAESLVGRCWKDLMPDMNDETWNRILASPDVVRIEARIEGRAFVFAHRSVPESRRVFIYGADVSLLRAAEEALRQSEKMATLGTLAAGVAHELNNPAAAAARGADNLRLALGDFEEAYLPLSRSCSLSGREGMLSALAEDVRQRASRRGDLDALAWSDREAEIDDWLDDHGVDDTADIAHALATLHYDAAQLDTLAAEWQADLPVVLNWIGRAQPIYALVREIGEATTRMSEIVKALKTYSHLGQAPVRAVDVTEGLESTLVIMRNKLKAGISVVREFAPDLPRIEAYVSELNQVWTNIIDNAADAMDGHGRIVLRARGEPDGVVVEIEDDGPGIPAGILSRVFDPFFTTKEPGRGTGLGLSTSRNIVVRKHGGRIVVESAPGRTRFMVHLPLRPPSAAAGDGSSTASAPRDEAPHGGSPQ